VILDLILHCYAVITFEASIAHVKLHSHFAICHGKENENPGVLRQF
jgi:hypothetical protein